MARSPIQGVGLFAAAPIPAGTVIWEFTPGVDWRIPLDDFEHFPEPYRSWLGHYVYREPTGCYVLCGDNAKFMNHSFEPNCDDGAEAQTVTRRDIAVGEELTCDYRSFDVDGALAEELTSYR